jgi:hypothetical protein
VSERKADVHLSASYNAGSLSTDDERDPRYYFMSNMRNGFWSLMPVLAVSNLIYTTVLKCLILETHGDPTTRVGYLHMRNHGELFLSGREKTVVIQ